MDAEIRLAQQKSSVLQMAESLLNGARLASSGRSHARSFTCISVGFKPTG
jgi:hypothetical protein